MERKSVLYILGVLDAIIVNRMIFELSETFKEQWRLLVDLIFVYGEIMADETYVVVL
jgi:hypothetical protein